MSTRDAFDLRRSVVHIFRNGSAEISEPPSGPHRRIDGYEVGAPFMTQSAPHGGEVHPDGDELLFIVSGRVTVVLEDEEPPRRVDVDCGQAFIVPQGVWHRVEIDEPTQLVYVTPGPRGAHRPRGATA